MINDTGKAKPIDPRSIMRFFQFTHLPKELQAVSQPFCDVAQWVDQALPDGAEKATSLRKLLEAKDAGVRAALK